MKLSLADKKYALQLVNEATSSGARVSRSSEVLEITPRTLQRWQKSPREDERRGPATCAHKLTDRERETLIKTANNPEFRDLSPRVIVPRLADQGVYLASESTFYRVLKEARLLAHRGRQRPRRFIQPPLAVIAEKPNTVWSWDITFLKSSVSGLYHYLYLVMDVYSRMIVGWAVHDEQNGEHAALLVYQSCKKHKVKRHQLVLHADNGGPMKGATLLATLQRLGVVPSFSRPAVSDDNPYSESLFKTLKYSPQYPSSCFETLETATAWVAEFVEWYNHKHLHSEIKYVTPASRHHGDDKAQLTKRQEVYKLARAKNPGRWKVKTRNWEHIVQVPLNHRNEERTTRVSKSDTLMAVKIA